MKKIISLLLVIVMAFSCAVPAFAAQEELPMITLFGDGTQIYMPDETAENGEVNVVDLKAADGSAYSVGNPMKIEFDPKKGR